MSFAIRQQLFDQILENPEDLALLDAFIEVPCQKPVNVPIGPLPSALGSRLICIASSRPGSVKNLTVDGNMVVTHLRWEKSLFTVMDSNRACFIADGKMIVRPSPKAIHWDKLNCERGDGKVLQLFKSV